MSKYHKRYTEQDVANWKALLDEGYGYKHVGEIYGVERRTVARWLPGRGMPHKEIVALGAASSGFTRKTGSGLRIS